MLNADGQTTGAATLWYFQYRESDTVQKGDRDTPKSAIASWIRNQRGDRRWGDQGNGW
jgi:hypothetical protein